MFKLFKIHKSIKKSDIKTTAFYFFSALFAMFIIFTFIVIIFNKPVITGALKRIGTIFWYLYLFVSLAAALIISFLAKKLNNIHTPKKEYLIFIIIITITVLTRFIWIYMVNVEPKSDFKTFHLIATQFSMNTVTGHKYISIFPHIFGYSVVLSLFYKVFGANIFAAQITNILFACGISLLIYILGKQAADWRSGLMSALIWALWPSQIFYSSLAASEMVFTFFFLLFIFLFIRGIEKKKSILQSVLFFLGIGMLCAIINAIRPLGIVLIIAAGIYYITNERETTVIFKNRIKLTKPILYMIMIITFFISANIINICISKIIGIRTASSPVGFNTYIGMNIESNGTWNLADSNELQDMINEGLDAQHIHDLFFDKAINRFKINGINNLRLFIQKFRVMWGSDNDSLIYIKYGISKEIPSIFNFFKYYNILNNGVNFYYYTMIFLCGMAVLKMLLYKENNRLIFIYIIILGITTVHIIVEVASRYHFPAVSLFSLIAGYGSVKVKVRNYL